MPPRTWPAITYRRPANLTLWQFPSVTVPEFDYYSCSPPGKDRSNPAGVLHTNFALDKAGGYLALVAPDGTTVVSEFNYGPAGGGHFLRGARRRARRSDTWKRRRRARANTGYQADGPPAEDVEFDRTGGVFSGSTTLTILPTRSRPRRWCATPPTTRCRTKARRSTAARRSRSPTPPPSAPGCSIPDCCPVKSRAGP